MTNKSPQIPGEFSGIRGVLPRCGLFYRARRDTMRAYQSAFETNAIMNQAELLQRLLLRIPEDEWRGLEEGVA